jgi:hypothetical protein
VINCFRSDDVITRAIIYLHDRFIENLMKVTWFDHANRYSAR